MEKVNLIGKFNTSLGIVILTYSVLEKGEAFQAEYEIFTVLTGIPNTKPSQDHLSYVVKPSL